MIMRGTVAENIWFFIYVVIVASSTAFLFDLGSLSFEKQFIYCAFLILSLYHLHRELYTNHPNPLVIDHEAVKRNRQKYAAEVLASENLAAEIKESTAKAIQ